MAWTPSQAKIKDLVSARAKAGSPSNLLHLEAYHMFLEVYFAMHVHCVSFRPADVYCQTR